MRMMIPKNRASSGKMISPTLDLNACVSRYELPVRQVSWLPNGTRFSRPLKGGRLQPLVGRLHVVSATL